MPSNILSADTGFPQFTKETSDKDKIEQITSYLYMLLEQLRYSFCNLDKDNFNETGFDEIVNIITEPVYVQLENDEKQILALQVTAEGLGARLEDAEGNITSLTATANSLTTRITNAEGDVSSLQQTATALQSRITTLDGSVSSLTQTVNSITLSVSNGESSSTIRLISDGGDSETLTITRSVPDMDFLCENENRLWGCKEDTIYASKLGDIFNWNVFDGVATDSYSVNVGSAGDFTACCSYLGYPCFFKEEHIYKVYGDKPSNFQVMGSASLGVEAGSDASIAIAGETLFYLARTGIVAYSGGIPQSMGAAFGTQRFRNAVGGSDGTKYYVSMKDTDDVWHLFVYDTLRGLWHREDALEVVGWGWNEELYFLAADGRLLLNGNARTAPDTAVRETEVSWMTEWADFYEYTTYSSASVPIPQKKGIGKLLVRLELDEGASVKIEMQFDSDGVWREVKTLQAEKKRSFYLPIVPRRCDHFRIRMTGSGGCRLYSLVREVYTGSSN